MEVLGGGAAVDLRCQRQRSGRVKTLGENGRGRQRYHRGPRKSSLHIPTLKLPTHPHTEAPGISQHCYSNTRPSQHTSSPSMSAYSASTTPTAPLVFPASCCMPPCTYTLTPSRATASAPVTSPFPEEEDEGGLFVPLEVEVPAAPVPDPAPPPPPAPPPS